MLQEFHVIFRSYNCCEFLWKQSNKSKVTTQLIDY